MGAIIVGTGIGLPDRIVTNHDLEKIMDTTDDWITSRTGVEERRLADAGIGSSDLAADAVRNAIADAGIEASDVDLLVVATMTPDQFAPGNAGLVQHKAGLGEVSSFDIRQQCSGFLYGLELCDALLSSGKARTAVLVGTEVHSGYFPYGESLGILRGEHQSEPTEADYQNATDARAWAVMFGDGAGAAVLQYDDDPEVGILETELCTDGALYDLIQVRGLGFNRQPYVDAEQLNNREHWPEMRGGELFRSAVTKMPAAVETVLDRHGADLDDLELVIAHQANERIVDAIRKRLGFDERRMPSNISRYGNTTAGTLPILLHELRAEGRLEPGTLACFTAFGAGAHWGAALYRAPS